MDLQFATRIKHSRIPIKEDEICSSKLRKIEKKIGSVIEFWEESIDSIFYIKMQKLLINVLYLNTSFA